MKILHVKILYASERVSTPWKNGGGTTTEVVVYPPGAGFDDFGWRVSIAEVRQGGPFSQFSGIDRCLAVLEGSMSLRIADRTPIVVSPDTPPALFSGDDRTDATLIGGAVVDLNVMTRRGAFVSSMKRFRGIGTSNFGAATIVVALTPCMISYGNDTVRLDSRDALVALKEFDQRVSIENTISDLYWIEILPV